MSKHIHEQFMEGFKKAAKRSGFTVSEPSYELGQNTIIEKTAEALEKNANPEFINNILSALQNYGQQGLSAAQQYGQQLGNFAQPYVNQGLDFAMPYVNKGMDFAKANPTMVGAGIGALAGGGLGAMSNEHALRNSILGALAGGGLGAGAGYGLGNYRQQSNSPVADSFDFQRPPVM